MALKKKEVREELSKLMGDPSAMEFNFAPGKDPVAPYTRSRDSHDPSDQFSEIVTCRIDGQLKRIVEEEVQLLYPYYRTTSDFVRDAIFKWAKYLHERYLAPGTPVEPMAIKLDVISKQAYEVQQRQEFTKTIASFGEVFRDLLRDPLGLPKLAEELAGLAEKIQDIDDAYWKARYVRELVEMPAFEDVYRTLRNSAKYQNSPLVKLLDTWFSQKYVLRDN